VDLLVQVDGFASGRGLYSQGVDGFWLLRALGRKREESRRLYERLPQVEYRPVTEARTHPSWPREASLTSRVAANQYRVVIQAIAKTSKPTIISVCMRAAWEYDGRPNSVEGKDTLWEVAECKCQAGYITRQPTKCRQGRGA
jgi:hypothetical protein